MKNVQKAIDALLGKAKLLRTEMRRSDPGSLIVDQLGYSLVFISPQHNYVYEMTYVDNFVNQASGPIGNQLIWHDYIMAPIRECARNDDPDLFYEILKNSKKKLRKAVFKVYVDGVLEYQSVGQGRAYTFVRKVQALRKEDEILAKAAAEVEERDGIVLEIPYSKYKDAKRIRVVNLAGNSTWFYKEPVKYSMD